MTVICRATPHKKPINTHIAPTVYGITVSRKNNPNQPIATVFLGKQAVPRSYIQG